jgi:hypothetical protein
MGETNDGMLDEIVALDTLKNDIFIGKLDNFNLVILKDYLIINLPQSEEVKKIADKLNELIKIANC